MTTDPAVEAAVLAAFFGPCLCPEPDPDAVWQFVGPDCVPHGMPEQKMEAALAVVRPIIEAEVRERIAAEIEAEADRQDNGMLTDYGQHNPCDAAWRHAARIARGGAS